jgi:peptidoglycan/xylan/chitin deacetylase (PgdA/CDA1 family)
MSLRITTSWDDGHVLDLRVAELLDKHGLTGTFYIARDFLPERMSDTQLRELATRHEIGAHTLTHPTLTEIPLEQARAEIAGSKAWLEDVLGHSVATFCYPKGRNNPALQKLVQDAGYTMARGVEGYALTAGDNRWCVPTTLQIYPYPLRRMPDLAWWRGWWARLQPVREVLPHMHTLRLSARALLDWQNLGHDLLRQAAQIDGIWHLWGHSWEIDRYDLWDVLDQMLGQAAAFSTGQAIPNRQLVGYNS